MGINLTSINLIDLLNTGITGFAVVLLYLGYRLTSDVQSKSLGQNPSDFSTVEMLKEWKNLVDSQLKNTRYFMFVALLFFAGGMLIYTPKSKIIVSVAPIEEGLEPEIRHQREDVTLDKNGTVEMVVMDNENIVISNNKVLQELHKLRLYNKQKQNMARSLVVKDVSTSNYAGFGL